MIKDTNAIPQIDSEKYDLEKNDTINSDTDKLTDTNNTCSVLIVKSQNNIHRKCEQEYVIKVYQKRWFLLALFIIITALNGIQWVQYSIITNITMRYYGISSRMVDYTSLVYLITYLPLVLPASYFMDKYVSSKLILNETVHKNLFYFSISNGCDKFNFFRFLFFLKKLFFKYVQKL